MDWRGGTCTLVRFLFIPFHAHFQRHDDDVDVVDDEHSGGGVVRFPNSSNHSFSLPLACCRGEQREGGEGGREERENENERGWIHSPGE